MTTTGHSLIKVIGSPRMDKNLKMGPRGDEKCEKRDLEQTKCSKNGT